MLQTHYKDSPATAVLSLYPEHAWEWWKFNTSPHGTWGIVQASLARGDPCALAMMRNYLQDELAPRANIVSFMDWNSAYYTLRTNSQIWRSLNRRFGGLSEMLRLAYPAHQWDFRSLTVENKSTEIT